MTGRSIGRFALALIGAIVTACASPAAHAPLEEPAPSRTPEAVVATATPAPTARPALYSKLRVFVASESTDQVWVLDGVPGQEFALVGKIPVGRLPHQLGVSPDGKWVAVNNRMSNTTSLIDPISMKEIARLKVGKQPHGILWSPDSATLFVAHERDPHIARFEATTWKSLAPLMVGAPQHVLAMAPSRPDELWFTLTNTTQSNVLRVYHLGTKTITNIQVSDVHDAFFTPDETEIWSTSSGFIDKPSDRIVIYDPATKTVKREIRLAGRYPFHTQKANQDGVFFMPDKSLMVLSDHAGPGLIWVDWRERTIVGETRLGRQPFHTTYDPEGDRLLVTTNVDGMVNVIDRKTRAVVQKLGVPKAHGIGAIPID